MEKEEIFENLIKHSRLFQAMDDEGERKLVALGQPLEVKAGEEVIAEGDLSESFFVIVRGRAEVTVTKGGLELSLAALTEGAFFGETAMILGQPRTASVTAISDLELLKFGRTEVMKLLEGYPEARTLVTREGLKHSDEALDRMLESDFVTSSEPPNPLDE